MHSARQMFSLNTEARQTCVMNTSGTWLPEVGPTLRCMTCATHDTCHCMMLLHMHHLCICQQLEDLSIHQRNQEPNLTPRT